MCDALHLIVVGQRSIVLIIAALAATLCIFLGWKLYKDAVISKAKGEFSAGGVRLVLSAASPGVFLVAFGIWLLMTLVNRPAVLESTEQVPLKPSNALLKPSTGGAFYLTQGAPKATPPVAPQAQAQPCLLRRTSIQFFTGEPLEPARIRDAMYQSIAALQSSQPIADPVELSALLGTLRQIAESADAQAAAK